MKLSNLATFVLNLIPVTKLRERITTICGRPRAFIHPTTDAFETDVARLTSFQLKAGGNRYGEARLAVEIVLQVSTVRGDCDNYCKSLLDGLQRTDLFDDDKQFDLVVIRRHFVQKGQEKITYRIAEYAEPCSLGEWLVLK